jgi:hypothetical protein
MGDYVHMVGMVIRDLAKGGDVLIVGRGSQVLLRHLPQAFHFQVAAPFQQQVETIMERKGWGHRDKIPTPLRQNWWWRLKAKTAPPIKQ